MKYSIELGELEMLSVLQGLSMASSSYEIALEDKRDAEELKHKLLGIIKEQKRKEDDRNGSSI